MRIFRRRAGFSCLSIAVLLLLFVIPVGAQGTITVIAEGGSDDLVPPPSPTCNDLVFVSEISFTPDGIPLGVPRLGVGEGLVTSFDVLDFEPVGPGVLLLDEVITFDGHANRDVWPAQPNERVQFEFLLDGVSQVVTPFTPDLPDDRLSAWLDLDMGAYDLPNGADALRILHFNDPGNTDSVVVSALCGRLVPDEGPTTTTTEPTATTDPSVTVAPTTEVAPTTVPLTTVPLTTVPPTTAPPTTVTPTTVTPTTVAPTTVAPTSVVVSTTEAPTTTQAATTTDAPTTTDASSTTEVTTEVEGQVEEQAQLAATGANDLGLALIAAGLVLVGSALLVQSKDPEELFNA